MDLSSSNSIFLSLYVSSEEERLFALEKITQFFFRSFSNLPPYLTCHSRLLTMQVQELFALRRVEVPRHGAWLAPEQCYKVPYLTLPKVLTLRYVKVRLLYSRWYRLFYLRVTLSKKLRAFSYSKYTNHSRVTAYLLGYYRRNPPHSITHTLSKVEVD